MTRRTYTLIASLLIVLLFAAANVAVSRWFSGARADFTGNKLYTLSASADRVLKRLVEPVQLEFVYSRSVGAQFPNIQSHATRVRELLREIETRADGKVILTETNPPPFSEEEDRVALAGLTPVNEDGDPLFFGVIGRNTVDDVIVIPFLSPDRDAFLEYDLVRLIAQLDDPSPPVIALLSGLPGFDGDGRTEGSAFILREMSRLFQLRPLTPDFDEIPADTDILMLVNPPPLDEARQYQIEQFLLSKGRALIALDPASRVASATGSRQTSSSLGMLSETLHVSLAASAVADPVLALPVEVDAGGGRTNVVGQPLFIAVPRALMTAEDPITGDLSRPINLGVAGALEASNAERLSIETLLESSAEAMSFPADLAVYGPDPRTVFDGMQGPAGARTLAVRISGPLQSAFVGGPPPGVSENRPSSGPPVQEPVDANVIVIADSDFLADGFYIDPSSGDPVADNAAFVLNALDNLAGGAALSELRSRAPALRPMTRIEEMRREAERRMFEEQRALEAQLAEYEGRLEQLEGDRRAALLTERSARQANDPDIERLREQILATRSQLREVERAYRSEIEGVESMLVVLNVWGMPLAAAIAGLGVFIWRSRRRAAPR